MSTQSTATDEPIALREVIRVLGRTKPTVVAYVNRPDFPPPLARLAVGRVWSRAAVEEWARTHLSHERARLRRPAYAITRRGETLATVTGRDARAALAEFARDRVLTGRIQGTNGGATLAVPNLGLLRACRVRTASEDVTDARKREARARRIGDEATAEAWRREAKRRAP